MYADDDEYHNKYINQSEFQQSYENVGGENDEMTPQFAMKSNKIGGKKVKIMKNTNIYPIQTILSSDDSISLSGITKVSLCIYRINIKPSSTPFLGRTLWFFLDSTAANKPIFSARPINYMIQSLERTI
jgi:hypothetical protein